MNLFTQPGRRYATTRHAQASERFWLYLALPTAMVAVAVIGIAIDTNLMILGILGGALLGVAFAFVGRSDTAQAWIEGHEAGYRVARDPGV